MRFPTWSYVAHLLQRYSHGAPLVDGLYVPEAPRTPQGPLAQAPCGKQQPLSSLTETGSKGAGLPGVKKNGSTSDRIGSRGAVVRLCYPR
jgi:hypothetical protein